MDKAINDVSGTPPCAEQGDGEISASEGIWQDYRVFFENASDAIIIMDLKGRLLEANPAACRYLGYGYNELLKMQMRDVEAPQYPSMFQDQIEPITHQKEHLFETAHRRKDGSILPVEVNARLIHSNGGEKVLALVRDLTSRKQAELTFTRYQLLAENNRDIVLFLRKDNGQITDANAVAIQSYGYSYDELLNKKYNDLNAIPAESPYDRYARMAVSTITQFEAEHRRKNGNVFPVEVIFRSARMGEEHLLVSLIHDISIRKRAEEERRKSEEQYRLLFEKMLDGFILAEMLFDQNGQYLDSRILQVNPAFEQITGLSTNSIIGKTFHEAFPEEDEGWHKYFLHLAHTQEAAHFESYFKEQDKYFEITIFSPQEKHIAVLLMDISDKTRAQQKVQSQFQRMAALRSIDQIITTSLNLRLILKVLLEQVLQQLGVDAADFLLLNPFNHLLEYSAGTGFLSENVDQTAIGLENNLAGSVALNRQTRLLSNLKEIDYFDRSSLLEIDQFVFYGGTPLIVKGQVKGILEVFKRSQLTNDQDWVDFFETLAGQAAVAIDNAGMFEGLQRSNIELVQAYEATVEGWSKALDLRDAETEGHTRRVTELTLRLGKRFGMNPEDLVHVQRGALLHDIGKMGIPDRILLKPGPLSPDEWKIMRKHPSYAYELISPIPFLRLALDIPYCHHERWDGKGYPRGLKEEEIPLAARIFTVVDVWDALRSDRPYRESWPNFQVMEYLENHSGKHFDPHVVKEFLELLREEKEL